MLKGWRDYFDTLLNNRNANVDLANKPEPTHPLNSIKTVPFTKIEIDQAIKEFSRKKSHGPDYAITAEVLKESTESDVNFRIQLISAAFAKLKSR